MNRSRFGQIQSEGSKRKNCCHSVYATGASAMGVPGWPEPAACTASIHSADRYDGLVVEIGAVSNAEVGHVLHHTSDSRVARAPRSYNDANVAR
jgi:hypothetical protein